MVLVVERGMIRRPEAGIVAGENIESAIMEYFANFDIPPDREFDVFELSAEPITTVRMTLGLERVNQG